MGPDRHPFSDMPYIALKTNGFIFQHYYLLLRLSTFSNGFQTTLFLRIVSMLGLLLSTMRSFTNVSYSSWPKTIMKSSLHGTLEKHMLKHSYDLGCFAVDG